MSSGAGTTGGVQGAQSEEAKRKAEATKQKAISEAKEGGKVVAEEAKAVGQKAGELGREHAERRFEQGKETLEGQVDAVGSALGDAAERLRAENNPLASYADELSGQLSQLSRGIENSTLDDVAVKTRQLARENPGLFVLGSMVAGLAAARFFKASAEREHRERYADDYDDYDYERSAYRGRDHYRDRGYGAAASVGSDAEYRSPVAGTTEPPRGAVGTSAAAGTSAGTGAGGTGTTVAGTTGTSTTSSGTATAPGSSTETSSVSRVPMDSGVASDATNPNKKSGA